MDETRYRQLMRTAALLTLAWIGWSLYDSTLEEKHPGAHELAAAARYLEDGEYQQALESYRQAQQADPQNIGILRGLAQGHMRLASRRADEAYQLSKQGEIEQAAQLNRQSQEGFIQALSLYDQAIARESARPETERNQRALGVSLANRGILKDRMADYAGALADYRESIRLEPKVTEGPGLLTRFLRNQPETPPSVADRADYLEQQLAKPESERLLSVPEMDAAQRAYKMD